MKRLFEIDLHDYERDDKVFRRPSARGIIFDDRGRLALVYSRKEKFYKFPGGGIQDDEDKKQALIREVREETGQVVVPESIEEFGSVLRRQKDDKKPGVIFEQENFYYLCKVENKIVGQNLDDYEAEYEFVLEYVTLDHAIDVNSSYKTENYFNEIMIKRETQLLQLIKEKRYLEETEYVDYSAADVKKLAERLKNESKDEIDLIQKTYRYVRDAVKHSWDAQDKRVTVSASDVLREGVGICWAKANLLAALLRSNGIPSGFSYQRLTLGDSADTGYCIHALNTVFVSSCNKWIRLDARGNKKGVDAEFSLDEEKLAFEIRSPGEVDYKDNHPCPDEKLMEVLKQSTDALDMYMHHLPDSLGYEE